MMVTKICIPLFISLKNLFSMKILNVPISQTNYIEVLRKVKNVIIKQKKIHICVCAVHLIMEAQKNKFLLSGLQNADIVTLDGMPLVWISKLYGNKDASRVYGPDLTLMMCELSRKNNYKIFLLGGAKEQSKKLSNELKKRFENLNIVGFQDTPIRPIPKKQNEVIVKEINNLKPDIIFVGLGCPNQELWMIENREKISAPIMIGVGAAFDFITGNVKQAPKWMQNSGLEWLYRLIQEPRRLWRRYFILNMLFTLKVSKQILKDFLSGRL